MDNVVSLMIGTPCNLTKQARAGKERDTHRGKIVEYIVRRHPLGLSEISRKVGISRRTLYNWFEKEDLGMSDIMKIGFAIGYDFSNEFPGVYEASVANRKDQETDAVRDSGENQAVYYWMEKYIRLMEQYNEILNCKMDKPER
jgi:lambda repressor-like predicted transcriptional regulator